MDKEELRKQKARENARRYYKKNKEKVLAKQKEYVKKRYATDEEFRKKVNERSRKYALNNLEKVREMKRNWARKHYKEMREKGLCKPTKNEIIENLQQRISQAVEYIENDLQISILPNNQIINGTEVVKRINKIIDILKGDNTGKENKDV